MSVHSLEEALQDSYAVAEIARRLGMQQADVRRVAAALGDLPAQQAARIIGIASADRVRQTNRETRKGERR